MEAMKPLAASLGADKLKRLVDLLGRLSSTPLDEDGLISQGEPSP
jgi:hypothetical protein